MKKEPQKKDVRKNTEGKDVKVFEKICDELATSDKGLLTLCTANNISSRTFYEWMKKDEANEKRYACAREEQAELLADQIIEIADDSSRDTKSIRTQSGIVEVENTEWTNRSKLRVEARKWTAAKLKPKKYGDKIDIQSTIKVEQPLFPDAEAH
jgi:hypothetical protein